MSRFKATELNLAVKARRSWQSRELNPTNCPASTLNTIIAFHLQRGTHFFHILTAGLLSY